MVDKNLISGGAENNDAVEFGFAGKLSDALVNLFKAGGFLLVFIFVGCLFLVFAAFRVPADGQYILMLVGVVCLTLPLLIVGIGFVWPVVKLRRELADNRAFIEQTEIATVELTVTVQKVTNEIISNHGSVAAALKTLRPQLDGFPLLANWIDSTQNLSQDVIHHALELRDAAKTLETAVRSGDASKLRTAIEKLKEIVKNVSADGRSKFLFEELDEKLKSLIDNLPKEGALEKLESLLSVASLVNNQNSKPSEGQSVEGTADALKSLLGNQNFQNLVQGFLNKQTSVPSKSSSHD